MAATLTDFLLARIAEDEAVARGIYDGAEQGFGRWNFAGGESLYNELGGVLATGPWGGGIDEEFGLHIARWDPARVLAECEARRAIVEVAVHADVECARLNNPRVGSYEDFRNAESEDNAMDKVIRFMAVPYADHPDYRDEWRPE